MTTSFVKYLMMSALACGVAACSGHSHVDADAHAAPAHDHAGVITLDSVMAVRLGVEVSAIEPGRFTEVFTVAGMLERGASGTAAAPAPASGTVALSAGVTPGARVERGVLLASVNPKAVSGGDAEAAARADLEAAERELERIEALYARRLVTAAEHTAAVAAAERARAAVSTGSGRSVTAPVSGTVLSVDVPQGGYVAAGDAVVTIAPDGPLTLRADVPSRLYSSLATVTDARFSLGSDAPAVTVSAIGGSRLGGAPASAAAGYLPVYFTIPASAGLPAGASATVWLLGAPRSGVLSVPLEALSEQQGTYYIYAEAHEGMHEYSKLPVTVGASDGERMEITSGLAAGTRIVTRGTTAVRLAEMQSVVPEGHSHSH